MTYHYNAKVKKISFRIGDLLLKKVFISPKEMDIDTLGPTPIGKVPIVSKKSYNPTLTRLKT